MKWCPRQGQASQNHGRVIMHVQWHFCKWGLWNPGVNEWVSVKNINSLKELKTKILRKINKNQFVWL